MDYTLVIGVDGRHLEQLSLVWPTWVKHKPSILTHPLVVFYDRDQLTWKDIQPIVKEHYQITVYDWPPKGAEYKGDPKDKWTNPQRHKMLSGFVHVPPMFVKTKYWLKLDLDTVATGMDDWIDESWFEDEPAIVSHPWGYTKPARQMLDLDEWTGARLDMMPQWLWQKPPLNLVPREGSSMVRHKRIISWCGFFNTEFTEVCSAVAAGCCELGQLPVPSQDGYLWYMAERGNLGIKRVNMKSRGWEHWTTTRNIIKAVERVML